MEADMERIKDGVTSALVPYRNAFSTSLVLHGMLFLGLVVVPLLNRPKRYLDENQVLMAEWVELEPPAPEPAQPAPVPPPPALKPPPKKAPEPLPEPTKPKPKPSPPPKKSSSEEERSRKLAELAERRTHRTLPEVEPERPYQPPVQPKPAATQTVQPPPKTTHPVTVKGKPFPYDYYLILVKNALWEIWRPPKVVAPEGISATVVFQIMRNGSVPEHSISLIRSSGIDVYDQSCLHAVRSVRLPPLPQGYPDARLELDCVFRAKE